MVTEKNNIGEAYEKTEEIVRKHVKRNEDFMSIINADSNDITKENANMNAETPAGMMMKFASEAAKDFVFEYVF